MVSQKLRFKTKKQLEDMNLVGFPIYQKQRWNSIYFEIQYTNKNFEGIHKIVASENFKDFEEITLKFFERCLKPHH